MKNNTVCKLKRKLKWQSRIDNLKAFGTRYKQNKTKTKQKKTQNKTKQENKKKKKTKKALAIMNTLEPYQQAYAYDTGNNLTNLAHQANSGNWQQTLAIHPNSNRGTENSKFSFHFSGSNMGVR
jgi:hypothetical protein